MEVPKACEAITAAMLVHRERPPSVWKSGVLNRSSGIRDGIEELLDTIFEIHSVRDGEAIGYPA
jgi:hypothetical protein